MLQQRDRIIAAILLGEVERGHVPTILVVELRLVLDQELDAVDITELGCPVEWRRAILQGESERTKR